MNKKPLIGVSICAVVLLILGSLSNVVGYQLGKSLQNHPPNAPVITGPQELKLGVSYLFTFVTTDPDGDNVSYSIDWGDGNNTGWVGPFHSGQYIYFAHTWTQKGASYIKAKAKDLPFEDESNWTIHPIRWSYSLSPQINYHNNLNNVVNHRELLFQTIVDIANNKEIQRIILKSQMSRGIFPTPDIPVITKNQLRQMYFLGLLLSKVISKSKMQSMIGKYQFSNSEMQKEIDAVIENNPSIKKEINQLQNSDCDCDNKNIDRLWRFPIICTLFIPLMIVGLELCAAGARWDAVLAAIIGLLIILPTEILSHILKCWWLIFIDPPFISDISPADGEQNVSLSLTELSFRLTNPYGNLMSYKVTTNPNIGEGSATLVPNGTYTINVHGVQHNTHYTWKILLYEGYNIGIPIAHTFTFTTAPIDPVISNPIPKHNASYVPINISNVSFDLLDIQGDLMNWTVETQPDIGLGSANGVSNGRYSIAINGLEYETHYKWFVNATDGTNWTNKTYVFTTTIEGLLVLEPIADTFVEEYSPNVNHGSDSYMLVSDKYGYTSNYDARGMVVFNLSELPSGITIDSVDLSLYYYHYDDTDPVGREITCHRILENWDEMTVTYNTMPISDPVECASTILPGYFTWVSWDVTSEADDFINGGDENYGWMIRDYKAPWGGFYIPQQYYCSSNADDLHPRLLVWFHST